MFSGGALRFLSLWRTVDSIAMAHCAHGKTKSGQKQLSLESRPLWARLAKLFRLCGLGCRISLLQIFHQSLVFRDQFQASLSSAALDFKQPTHQLGKVLHSLLHHG
jgi:hypothetical protein